MYSLHLSTVFTRLTSLFKNRAMYTCDAQTYINIKLVFVHSSHFFNHRINTLHFLNSLYQRYGPQLNVKGLLRRLPWVSGCVLVDSRKDEAIPAVHGTSTGWSMPLTQLGKSSGTAAAGSLASDLHS